ncbi:MAG: pilus assembly protein PilM, partial [Candidatus Omnitrophica bacterium]|nr:pilus assembly protein PilM [Candidatus Omnitrophota bacterium]
MKNLSGIKIKKLNPLLRRHSQDLVGIDFSSNNLKLAHVKITSNKLELVDIVSHDITDLGDDDISKIIKDTINELNVKNVSGIDIIPSHMVITKNIEIPSTNPIEIREIINLQASRYTPYSREEIIVDYIDIDTYKHSYTKILLVIVARNIVKRHFEILNKAGIRSENVVFAPEALSCFVPRVLKLETKTSPIGIIHVDEDFSDFIVVSKNKPVFIRTISIGMHHILGDIETYRSKFAEEITRTLEGYQNEDIEKSPGELILTGAMEEAKFLETILKDSLHLPTRIMPHFKDLITLSDGLKTRPFPERLSFLNILASLFSRGEVKVNLIPEEVKLSKSLEDRG